MKYQLIIKATSFLIVGGGLVSGANIIITIKENKVNSMKIGSLKRGEGEYYACYCACRAKLKLDLKYRLVFRLDKTKQYILTVEKIRKMLIIDQFKRNK